MAMSMLRKHKEPVGAQSRESEPPLMAVERQCLGSVELSFEGNQVKEGQSHCKLRENHRQTRL